MTRKKTLPSEKNTNAYSGNFYADAFESENTSHKRTGSTSRSLIQFGRTFHHMSGDFSNISLLKKEKRY